MKEESNLLCKKSFNLSDRRFFANKQYRCLDTTSDRQIYILGEDGNGLWFSTRIPDKKIINPSHYDYLETYAWEYFYTINEMRKMKLEKLANF